MKEHLVIPDTQVRPGDDLSFLRRIGQYALDKRPDVIVHLGDHYDMPSLSSYDKGKRVFEGRRYRADIQAGNDGLSAMMEPIQDYNRRRARNKKSQYAPRLVMIRGNHEARILRATNDEPMLDGTIGYHDFNDVELGWEPHEFLCPVTIDGVTYAHYFYNPMTGKPFGGNSHTKLKNVGHTFTMGHQQGLDVAYRILPNGTQQIGIVAGSCYEHDESYKGPQGNHHWRGLIYKHEVRDGRYDPMFVSLDYLQRRYR